MEEGVLDNVTAPHNGTNISGINLINNSLEVHRNSVAGAQTDTEDGTGAGSGEVEEAEPEAAEEMEDRTERNLDPQENTNSQLTNNSEESE